MAIQFSGLASGLDTDNIIKDLMKAERMKVEKIEKEKTKLEWKKDIWEDMNSKLYSFYTKHVFKLKSKGTFSAKSATSSNESALTAKASVSAVTGSHTITVNRLAKGSFLTGSELIADRHMATIDAATTADDLEDFGGSPNKTISISLDHGATYTDVLIEPTDTLSSIASKIASEVDGISASYDNNFKRLMLSTKEQGASREIIVGGDDGLLSAMGFMPVNRTGTIGQDAEIEYNSTTLTTSSNEVNVNGMTLTLVGEGQTANITVNQDTEAIYDNVKEFVTEYNKLLVEINEKINADRAKGFEPLTDEEKEAMSDEEVRLWEDRIKDSLLRRDSILSSLLSSVRETVTISSGVTTTDFEYKSLSQLGIVTDDYTEKGILHVNGDEDDPLFAVKENDLKKAIEDDPEKVAELLNAIGDKVYSTMQDKMKSTTLSSALTFFNDKQIDSDLDDYEERIEDLEERLLQVEQRYYKQFTAMEQAIQAMNNQSASLASMLGGGA